MISLLKYLLLTSRLSTSSISGLTVFFMLLLSNKVSYQHSFYFGVVFLFVTMFGFIVNDIFDYKKDKLAHRDKPIAQDKLKRSHAILFSFILALLSLIIEYLIGNSISFTVVSFTIILLTIYSILSLKLPVFKGLITGLLCIMPILYVATIINTDFHHIVYFIVLLYIFGRELYMDAQDFNGDNLSKLKTIPFYLGIEKSKFLGLFIMLFASIILITYSFYTYDFLFILLSFISSLIMILSIFISYINEKKAISLTKLSMFFAIIPLFGIAI